MIDIRCHNHLHLRVDPGGVTPEDAVIAQIKCDQCSRKRRKQVFHTFRLADVAAVAQRGQSILWIDEAET